MSYQICCAVRLKELPWVWEMASNWSRHKVDDVQAMSEGKNDGMDTVLDSDIDGSEVSGCEGSVDDLLIKLLSLRGMVSLPDQCHKFHCSVCPVGFSIAVGVSLCFIGLTLMWYHVYDVVVGCGAAWEQNHGRKPS